MMPELTLGEIAEAVGGRLEGERSTAIRGVSPLESAGPAELSFVANARYAGYLQATRAGGLLVSDALADQVPEGIARIVVADPHAALYRVLPLLYPEPTFAPGVGPGAVIGAGCDIDPTASIGAHAVLGDRVKIGAGTRIGPHVVIGDDVEIGRDTAIHPHVTVHHRVSIGARCVIHSGVRLGREGFGFTWMEGGHRKIPQVGGCIIEDDVEIGPNSNVDRGSVGDTVVGAGTKIDALVHLGHNVKVGRHVIIVAQVGVSGSTVIEEGAVLGGQVGVGGHLTIGAGAKIGAQAGVTASVPAGETYSGYPARPHRESLRAQGAVFRLPRLIERVRRLEQAIFGKSQDGNERREKKNES